LDNPDTLRETLDEFCRQDPHVAELLEGRSFPDELSHIQISYGHAARYGGPGAILIGDAVHPVSPAGGQGANMSVADARNSPSFSPAAPPLICQPNWNAAADQPVTGRWDLLALPAAYSHCQAQRS